MRDELKKNSATTILDNNISWARHYLVIAGYIDSPERGVWALSDKAKKELPSILELIKKDIANGMGGFPLPTGNTPNVEPFNSQVLYLFSMARDQGNSNQKQQDGQQNTSNIGKSMDKETEDNFINNEQDEDEQKLQEELNVIRSIRPDQFERLCVRLFKGLGYEDVKPTPQSRDGGYDGVGYLVSGLVRFKVIFQAKRYAQDNKISGPNISEFLGTMDAPVNAEKGVFITTSYFSPDAQKRATALGGRIALVNGEDLIKLLREYRIGYVEEIVINPDFFKNL